MDINRAIKLANSIKQQNEQYQAVNAADAVDLADMVVELVEQLQATKNEISWYSESLRNSQMELFNFRMNMTNML